MSREWNDGPPPHAGWWNASVSRDPDAWRWWNGDKWSHAAFPEDALRIVDLAASVNPDPEMLIEWTTYWPANAIVPRVKP